MSSFFYSDGLGQKCASFDSPLSVDIKVGPLPEKPGNWIIGMFSKHKTMSAGLIMSKDEMKDLLDELNHFFTIYGK